MPDETASDLTPDRLLAIAEQTLTATFAATGGDDRFVALMIASALRMVGRAMTHGDALAAARRLLLDQAGGDGPEAAHRLIAAIRAGHHDRDDALHAALMADAAARSAVTKPGALNESERRLAGVGAQGAGATGFST